MASAGSCNPNPNPNPVSLASLRVCCSCSSFKIAAFPRPSSCLLKLRFSSYSRSRNCIFTIPSRPRLSFSTPVACADPDHPWQVGDPEEEAGRGHQSIQKQKLVSEQEQGGGSQLKKRVVFGLVIGICAGAVVLVGGWVFTMAMSAAIFTGSREYFELVRSQGISAGMTPPPRYVSRVCSVICALMPILTLYFGDMGVSVTLSAFIIAMALILQRGNPRFAQLSSAIFGLFYCGYLPSFWVKLRCGLAAPALNTKWFCARCGVTCFVERCGSFGRVGAVESFLEGDSKIVVGWAAGSLCHWIYLNKIDWIHHSMLAHGHSVSWAPCSANSEADELARQGVSLSSDIINYLM